MCHQAQYGTLQSTSVASRMALYKCECVIIIIIIIIITKCTTCQIWQDSSSSKHASIDGVIFLIWRHTFKMAATTSLHAEKCCHLDSKYNMSCLPSAYAAAFRQYSIVHSYYIDVKKRFLHFFYFKIKNAFFYIFYFPKIFPNVGQQFQL